MSRVIHNDHLWDTDEVRYQEKRDRHSEVKANRKMFGPGGDLEGQDLSKPEPEEVQLSLDQDIYEKVRDADVKSLQQGLSKYKLDTKGDENTLRTRLAMYLQNERDASANK